MARVDELFTEISNYFDEFKANHETFNEKGNKAAAGRARKAIGEIKKLVTEYRKESVATTKQEAVKMEFISNLLPFATFGLVAFLVYKDTRG